MVLPLYLARTDREMLDDPPHSFQLACLGCHFSQTGTSLDAVPARLPPDGMLIVDDRVPFERHDPRQIADQLKQLACGSVLLDWERPPTPATRSLAQVLADTLPCPVGMPPGYENGPVFLPPCPLHIPLEDYLRPFQGREIWLEVALPWETITVTPQGTTYGSTGDRPEHGRYDDTLRCCYTTATAPDRVIFTLFDTWRSLEEKMGQAAALGVTRAVGLYQEFSQKLPFKE